MSDYEILKGHIDSKLRKEYDSSMKEDVINKEIESTRKLLNKSPELFSEIIGAKDTLRNLSDDQWNRMRKELETQFDVSMGLGALIEGKEQRQRRDKTWWSQKIKPESDNYYWYRYKKSLEEILSFKVTQPIDDVTDRVMDNIGGPELTDFNIRGMVVGHVQSGKTGNYTGLICKAADAGYKVIVVIAGATNNLRNQTQERLNYSFVGRDRGVPLGVGIGEEQKDREKAPISLTTVKRDFNKSDADNNMQTTMLDSFNAPILLVIKKNSSVLGNLIKWLKAQAKGSIKDSAILVIDDESDYASVNTKDENDPTMINRKIRELLEIFPKRSYVAYTATPFANIFIDHEAKHEELEDDLFPRDFIFVLDAPDNYMGAREIFLRGNEKNVEEELDDNNNYLVPIDDYVKYIPMNHKKNFEFNSLPPSLKEAIQAFLINIAIRHLRGQDKQHNSMMIHISRFTNIHKQVYLRVAKYVEEIRNNIKAYGSLKDSANQSDIVAGMKTTFSSRYTETEIKFNWQDVLSKLVEIVDDILVREIHSRSDQVFEYRNDKATNVLVVGGLSLSRGYTLGGLSISYFIRSTKFYDTLMQMGRWFGYRDNYEDLCKIYAPREVIGNYVYIIGAMESLYEDFKEMSRQGMTPLDFGLAVQRHPDSLLQITARNKQKNVNKYTHEMCLDGRLTETSRLLIEEDVVDANIESIKYMINKLSGIYPLKEVGTPAGFLWRSIDKKIISDFLEKFTISKNDRYGLFSRMPITHVKKYTQNIETEWDVAIYSGKSKEEWRHGEVRIHKQKRKLQDVGDGQSIVELKNRQVSAGASESIVLSKTEIKNIEEEMGKEQKNIRSERTRVREDIKRPLLMLHILECTHIEDKNDKRKNRTFAAFGVSFPKSIKSGTRNIELVINTVGHKQLDMFLNDDGADD